MSNFTRCEIFKTKERKIYINTLPKSKPTNNYNNFIYKARHDTPFAKEWLNSVYAFNGNMVKWIPSLDISAYNLIKNFFNMYAMKFNKIIRTKLARTRMKRFTANKLIASKPNLKHTNDKVTLTVYTYDRNTKYYINKLAANTTLDKLSREEFTAFSENLKQKCFNLQLDIQNSANMILNNITVENHNSLLRGLSKSYLNTYIKKNMKKEIVSISHKQSLLFERSKYEKQHLLLLTTFLERIYNKKIVLDIVNLRYFFNSSSVLSNAIITKLKRKGTKAEKTLTYSLDTYDVPALDRINTYNDMYNKNKFVQNASLKNMVSSIDDTSNLSVNSHTRNLDDIIEKSLLNDSFNYSSISPVNKTGNHTPNIDIANSNEVISSLKNKFTNGIRIEIAGRLTRRNVAEKSLTKLRYKGSVKNADSSYKGLSVPLLRGHAKSNLVYNESRSKMRIGAFGLKTWVSGT